MKSNPKLTRISEGPLGEKIWWFGDHVKISRIPATYSGSGRLEYWVHFLPTPNCMRSRVEHHTTWADARHVVADPVGTQL